jgi:thiol-disulfide isomerase/thioredoxin
MFVRSLALTLFVVAFAGCGGQSTPTDSAGDSAVLPTASAPTVSDEAAAAEEPAAPTAPPGKIEMPAGVVPPEPAAPAEANGAAPPKAGGFEMPAAGEGAPPVVVQRPVLDDAPSDAEVVLTAAKLDAIQKHVAGTGKVTVVDFWSLSCEPCIKEFPGLVKLHREFGDKVTCISVDVDFDGRKSKPAETYRPRVEAFLKSVDATFANYLCETANEEVYAALKIVSIPAVLVYDGEGKLVRTFTDSGKDVGFSYEKDIAPLVKSLLTP